MLLLLLLTIFRTNGAVRYVKPAATGTGDGSSWANASGDLQAMIDASSSGDAVYAAAGTYYARRGRLAVDERPIQGNPDRYHSFVMKEGVSVYGGFPVNANAGSTPENRPKIASAKYGWQLANPSILTGSVPAGEINMEDDWTFTAQGWSPLGYIDNALHVVWFAVNGFQAAPDGTPARANPLNVPTVLDGFTIEGGNADGGGVSSGGGTVGASTRLGGGVYLAGNGVIRNCIVQKNYALARGGGVFTNYGGTVSDCFVGSNACPGDTRDNSFGFGGGVYLLGKGFVERSFVVNNSSRVGGGLFITKALHDKPYEAVVEMSIIANNTARHEAGGIYADSAGILTSSYVLYNNTQSIAVYDYGKTGGIFCDHYMVVTNTALYGNTAPVGIRQFYAVNTTQQTETEIASLQLFHSAVWDQKSSIFGMGTVQSVIDLATGNNQDPYRSAGFKRDPNEYGILEGYLDPAAYLTATDWDKEEYSAFIRAGATEVEAPRIASGSTGQVNIPLLTIDGKSISGSAVSTRPGIGPYYTEGFTINPVTLAGIRYVFVDNTSPTPGNGSSWDSPLRFIGPALKALADAGGGTVCIKQGVYYPVRSNVGGGPRAYSLEMRNGVAVQGGYAPELTGTDRSLRNPVQYRTVISGDVGIKGDLSDNLYHLVFFNGITDAVLDGVNLMYANSEGSTQPGGAVWLSGGSRNRIQNCIIENNRSVTGAAVYASHTSYWNAESTMWNSVINNNESTGGYAVDVACMELVNVTIVMNTGNGIRVDRSPGLFRSVVWGNSGTQCTGAASICAIQGGVTNDQAGDIGLTTVVNDETAAQYFVNPTFAPGIVTQGYGTLDGEIAIFRPQCTAPFLARSAHNPTDYPVVDIVGINRTDGGMGKTDCGAYQSVCGSGESSGRIWYVKVDGNGSGATWDAPISFAALMQNSIPPVGDQIWVAAGTHTLWGGTFEMFRGVKVYGGFPANATSGVGMESRDPQTNRTVLSRPTWIAERVLRQVTAYSSGEEAVWDGFVIQGGDRGGVSLKSGGRLVQCEISGNSINTASGTGYVETNSGAGVYNDGGVLENCLITNNTLNVGSGRGGGVYMTSGTLYNCLIAGNTATGREGSAVAVGNGTNTAAAATAELFNVTIANNTGTSDIYVQQGFALRFYNGIAMRGLATPAQPVITTPGATDPTIGFVPTYSCIYGRTVNGVGNITANPQLAGGGSYQLTAASPCINAGGLYPFGQYLPSTDLAGGSRINNCAMDMGAYEYGSGGGNTLLPAVIGDTARLYVTYYGSGQSNGSSWENALCADLFQLAINYLSASSAQPVRQVWVGTGMNYPATEAVFYPTEKASPELSDRFKTFTIRPGVDVLGHFKGDEQYARERVLGMNRRGITVLDGNIDGTPANRDDVYRVVTFAPGVAGQPATLENFAIRNGNANHPLADSLRMGGGVFVRPGGMVSNCYIYACNAAVDGGGVYLSGSGMDDSGFPNSVLQPPVVARLNSSVVEGCQAASGGGVYAGPYAMVTGSTVVRNKAALGGGLFFSYPPALIHGTVLWRNEAPVRRNIAGGTETPYEHALTSVLDFPYYPVNYSAVEGEQLLGRNNLLLSSDNEAATAAPGFQDPEGATLMNMGWEPDSTSSLIDAGLTSEGSKFSSSEQILNWYRLSPWDIGGGERIRNTYGETMIMDIGAYETQERVELDPDANSRLYVTRVGRGRKDGSSWANATPDLQSALNYFRDHAQYGQVWVQGGNTYIPFQQINGTTVDEREVSFVLNPYVSLYGGFKGDPYTDEELELLSETALDQRLLYDYNDNGVKEKYEFQYVTTLDGAINPDDQLTNSYHVLYYAPETLPANEIVLNGVTVKNGQARSVKQPDVERKRHGAGLYATAPVRVEACVFTYNEAEGDGGAICLRGGGSIFRSSIERNWCELGDGGGIYVAGGKVIECNVFNNTAVDGNGGGIAAQNSELLNVVVVQNESAEGGGLSIEGGEVYNTVVWSNRATNPGGAEVDAYGGTILYSALPEGINGVKGSASGLTDASIVWLPAENSVSGGPRFIRPISYPGIGGYAWTSSWKTGPGSSLTDRGNNTKWTDAFPTGEGFEIKNPAGMWVTVPRIEGGSIDIGTYERIPVTINPVCDTLYVRTWENPNEDCDGSTWDKATTDLEGAIRALSAPGRTGKREIWIAQGEYAPVQKRDAGDPASRSFLFPGNGVAVFGGFPDDGMGGLRPGKEHRNPIQYETVLNGKEAGSDHVVYVPANSDPGDLRIDGVMIRGGKISGIYAGASAGELVVNRCLFTANGSVGGQVQDSSAALFARRPVRSYNCLFYANNGAALNAGTGSVVNNTIVSNKGGGLRLRDASPSTVMNTVLWGNGLFQQQVSAQTAMTYCATMGPAVTGAGNIVLPAENYADPGVRFRNDADPTGLGYLPGCASLLIDQGNNAATTGMLPDAAYDLVNKARIFNGRIDIGVFESELSGTPGPAPVITWVSPATNPAVCQNTVVELQVGEEPGSDVFWFRDGSIVGTAPNFKAYASEVGVTTYSVVYENRSSGCRSNVASQEVHVEPASGVTDLAGPALYCTGTGAVPLKLTFTPVSLPGYTYELFQDGVSIQTGITTGEIELSGVSEGEHIYHLNSRKAGAVCSGGQSNYVQVRVESLDVQDPDALTLLGGEKDQGVCTGDELEPIRFQYAPGMTVLNPALPAGITFTRDPGGQRIVIIEGAPRRDFTYTVRTRGNECSSASVTGTISLLPLPAFKLGQ
ncbi:MAG: right-handed parallel beta-helix repeat-containing protein [Culturomica sp.]|nr:right-handed parallel beta-helix repeat-containing protein [Culturomica sp.]